MLYGTVHLLGIICLISNSGRTLFLFCFSSPLVQQIKYPPPPTKKKDKWKYPVNIAVAPTAFLKLQHKIQHIVHLLKSLHTIHPHSL